MRCERFLLLRVVNSGGVRYVARPIVTHNAIYRHRNAPESLWMSPPNTTNVGRIEPPSCSDRLRCGFLYGGVLSVIK